jgi:hypothetical protein
LLADFRGALETDDGATILFSWQRYAPGSCRQTRNRWQRDARDGNERYAWLNNALCALAGEVRPREDGSGFDVVFDVSELIWGPLS